MAGQAWSSHTSFFLKKDGGAGEGETEAGVRLSSCEKKVFPFPRNTDLYREQREIIRVAFKDGII